jgi:Holliday junction resolvasome RuvABC endonuclease subunit
MSAIIAFDLGTTTGWAIYQGGIITSGHKSFITKPPQHPGKRYELFYSWLRDELDGKGIEAIYYEEVMNHTGAHAAHLYGALQALLLKFACHRRIPVFGKGVGEIKKFWTGKGNAKKKDMIEEAHKKGFTGIFDDNEADALALLHLAISLRKGK